MDFKDVLGYVNVEVKALEEPDIIGIERRQRQQILFLLFIFILVLCPLGRPVGGKPGLPKAVWTLGLFLLLTF